MLTRYASGTGDEIKRERLSIAFCDVSFHPCQYRFAAFRSFVTVTYSAGKRAEDRGPELLVDTIVESLRRGSQDHTMSSGIEQACHASQKWKWSSELSKIVAQIFALRVGSESNPAMACFLIACKGKVFSVSRAEKNCVILGHLDHFVVEGKGEVAAVNDDELIVHLSSRPDATALGIQDIANDDASILAPSIGFRKAFGFVRHGD
jgi:hypothetical protein